MAPASRRSLRRVMVSDRAAPGDVVERLWADPDQLLATGTMLKDGDRTTVVRLDGPRGSVTLKRYNLMGPLHTALRLMLRSRARWSWVNGRRALAAGLHTPRPLACLEERWGPLRGRSFFLCEHRDGDPLLELVRAGGLHRDRLDRLAARFVDIWETLGRQRLSHGDMKASNFIVDEQDELWMLDLDGMRREWLGLWWRRQRARDQARFMKNWRGLGECEEVFLACVDRA